MIATATASTAILLLLLDCNRQPRLLQMSLMYTPSLAQPLEVTDFNPKPKRPACLHATLHHHAVSLLGAAIGLGRDLDDGVQGDGQIRHLLGRQILFRCGESAIKARGQSHCLLSLQAAAFMQGFQRKDQRTHVPGSRHRGSGGRPGAPPPPRGPAAAPALLVGGHTTRMSQQACLHRVTPLGPVTTCTHACTHAKHAPKMTDSRREMMSM